MVKLVGLLKRKDSMTHAQFRDRWDEHVAVVEDLAGVEKYVQSIPVDPDSCPYDGIAELHFESAEACREAFDTEAGDLQLEDAAEFVAFGDHSHGEIEAGLLTMLFDEQPKIE